MLPDANIYEMVKRSDEIDTFTSAEFYLISANIESFINDYLLSNGTLIDPKTRLFLANLREVTGAMARRAKNAV